MMNNADLQGFGVSRSGASTVCSKAEASYPLILSDDARLVVYYAACAAQLATEILVDLYTFLSPPAPNPQLFVLTPPGSSRTSAS